MLISPHSGLGFAGLPTWGVALLRFRIAAAVPQALLFRPIRGLALLDLSQILLYLQNLGKIDCHWHSFLKMILSHGIEGLNRYRKKNFKGKN